MHIDFLRNVFQEASENDALVWRDSVVNYRCILEELDKVSNQLDQMGFTPGSVVSVEADFSARSIALLLTLIEKSCIVVPLSRSVEQQKPEFRRIAEVETIVIVDEEDRIHVEATANRPSNELLIDLKQRQHPGLILFSSGSTGKSKASLHDILPMLEKYKVKRHNLRTITFLLFDHIGGFNTLLYNLSNAGCIVTVGDRNPATICRAIQQYKVELLPTSPTFLNLLLVSGVYKNYDLSSLQTVTYGTEVMPESTLKRFHEAFPRVKLLQTYGLSEVGILRSKSKSCSSLWLKVGGEGFETRVVEKMLEIKAQSAMLGYLNAPSPFTPDGWFRTGDVVEVDGEYIRIMGRKSEIINVGGEKVYPAEVESMLQLMAGVIDVAVTGQSHPMTGQIVFARVKLDVDEALSDFRKRMRHFCAGRLSRFKIPQKVELVTEELHSDRFKKMRRIG